MVKIAFLDRDGTLNVEKDYLNKWKDFEWIDGAKDMLKAFKNAGYILAVITNQSGIARGFYSEEDVLRLHEKVNEDLFRTHGVKIDFFEFCPHHPDFTGICECRKPGDLMLKNIISHFDSVDFKKSFILGDHIRDLEAGNNLGIKGYLTAFGHGKKFQNQVKKEYFIENYIDFFQKLNP
jgi:D,D-heptose 1,7-bisphosphate phosphatase